MALGLKRTLHCEAIEVPCVRQEAQKRLSVFATRTKRHSCSLRRPKIYRCFLLHRGGMKTNIISFRYRFSRSFLLMERIGGLFRIDIVLGRISKLLARRCSGPAPRRAALIVRSQFFSLPRRTSPVSRSVVPDKSFSVLADILHLSK